MKMPPSNSHNKIASWIDYGRTCWVDVAEESDATDFVTHVTAVGPETGFETITYHDEKPFFHSFDGAELPSLRERKMRRYPEGLLRMARDRPETLEWISDGVISLADGSGTRIVLYLDSKTHLPARWETLRSHAIAGDTVTELLFDDYRQVGRLRLPFHTVERVAGIPVEELQASSIELDTPLPAERFVAPRNFAAMAGNPPQPTVEKIGEGLFLIRGPYNSVFAVFRDHVMVLEAPLNSGYSEDCRKLIHSIAPGKPVRYVVATHFHFDHVGGLRPYIAEGIPILTTSDARGVIEQVAAARHTMHPDVLLRSDRAPKIEIVRDKRVFDDGTNRAELYELGPTDHVAQMLIAYFPKQKLLFEADVWDILSPDLAIAGSDTVSLARRIQQLGLDVERIVPVHGPPGTMAMLRDALAVRAKYIH
jgi:glyoxylase-like metal-dependent hydrolase (beta-lactamase superfamily II)